MRDCFSSIYEEILFDLNEYIYVSDYETDDIIYLNKKIMDVLKIDESSLGCKCYEALMGSKKRCSFCPKLKLSPTDFNKKIKWESFNGLIDIVLENEGNLIQWHDGRLAYFQKSVDITEHKALQKKSDDRLARQELMAEISQSFIAGGDINQGIDNALIKASDIMDYKSAMLLKFNAETNIITCSNLYYSNNSEHKISDLVPKYFRKGELIYDQFITNKAPYIILKNEECSYYEFNYNLGMRGTLIFPVWCEDVFLGVIKFDRFDADYLWEDDDLHLAGMIAGVFSSVLNQERISKNLILMNEVIEQSSQLFCHFEKGGNFRYFNNATSKLTGYSRKELCKYGYNLMHDAETIKKIENEIIPALMRGERVSTELAVICKDKSVKYLEYLFFPVNMVMGTIAIDVTENKLLKNELDITKQQLAIAVESSGIGVWDINVETQILSFDNNFAKIFRMPENMKSPISLKDWTEYLSNIVDKEKYGHILDYHRNYDGQMDIDTENVTYKFADDDYLFIRNSKSVIRDKSGEIKRTSGITWDITEDVVKTNMLKETQEKLDIAIKISNSGAWDIDIKNDIVNIDESTARLIRFDSKRSMPISEYYEYLRTIVKDEKYLMFLKEGYKNPFDISNKIIDYNFGENDSMYLSHFAKVIYDKLGKPERLIGMSVDITLFTFTEKALQKRLKQQEIMADISQRFVNYTNIDNAINESIRLAGEFADVSSIHIYKHDNVNDIYKRMYNCDFKDYKLKFDYISGEYIESLILLSENDITIAENLAIDANMIFDNLSGTLEYSHIGMPLMVNNVVWGFIGFASYDTTSKWSYSDKDLLRFLAGMIGTAIEGEIAHSELTISESTLNAVIDNMPIAVSWKNPLTKIYEGCNQAFLNYIEKNVDEVVGKHDCEIFSKDYMIGYREREKAAQESTGTVSFVIDLTNNSNEHRTMKMSRTVLRTKDGVPFREICTVEDITESNRIENQIREMLERHNLVIKNYNGVIVNIGLDGKVKLFGGKSLFGLQGDDVIGKHYYDTCANQPLMRNAVEKCFTEGTQSFIYHGDDRVTKCQATQVFDDEGNVTSVLFIGQDITELYKVQNELENTIITAVKASRAKSDFLALMSHEIRTPMNVIVGMSRMASRANEMEKVKNCLMKIDTASANLLELINQILDMSKIEANKLELEMAEFSLKSLINEITLVMGMKIEEKHLNLSIVYENEFNPNFLGDRLRLSQIITNLLSNAIKFTDVEGNITIKIKAEDAGEDYSKLVVSVIDTGIGIKKDKQKSIFNYFEQADGSTSRRYGGSGLGLAICQNITKLMDGDIYVESEEGKGSNFTFYVRLKKIDTLNNSGNLKNVEFDYNRNLDGKKILIAEDNEINREIAINLIEDLGIEVYEAENGKIAVDMFLANPELYDLILMDLQMPEMDGYEATRIIRAADNERAASISVLAMTANVFKSDVEMCLQVGMNDHIPKPIDPVNLRDKIYRYIR